MESDTAPRDRRVRRKQYLAGGEKKTNGAVHTRSRMTKAVSEKGEVGVKSQGVKKQGNRNAEGLQGAGGQQGRGKWGGKRTEVRERKSREGGKTGGSPNKNTTNRKVKIPHSKIVPGQVDAGEIYAEIKTQGKKKKGERRKKKKAEKKQRKKSLWGRECTPAQPGKMKWRQEVKDQGKEKRKKHIGCRGTGIGFPIRKIKKKKGDKPGNCERGERKKRTKCFHEWSNAQ